MDMAECIRCGSKSLVRARLRDVDVEAAGRLQKKSPQEVRAKAYQDTHKTLQAAYTETLQRYRVGNELADRSDPLRHAIRDQLVANFSLKPSPPPAGGVRRNHRSVSLGMADTGDYFSYKPHLKESDVQQLLAFVGEKNTFSLLSYERMFQGGHQMAFWCDSSRLRFFDPNFGVISFSFQSGMKTFLSRYLPFLYYWKGTGGKRDSATFLATKSHSHQTFSWTETSFDVYRYSL